MKNPSIVVEEVVLVDENDNEVGTVEKHQAHVEGTLHRAFSIFLVDRKGQLLLQRRSFHKYHSPGLWANSCCGHPRPGESIRVAAKRRLMEELGVEADLSSAFQARYRAPVGNGMAENELVEVFFGPCPAEFHPDPDEVEAVGLYTLPQVAERIEQSPEQFAAWLRHYVAVHYSSIADWVRAVSGKGDYPLAPQKKTEGQ